MFECRHSIASKEHPCWCGRSQFASSRLGRESSSRARYEIKEKAPSHEGGGEVATGAPGPTHGDVPSFGVSYHRPELIPPLKLGPHPQSCAVSTHQPMKAPGSLQARRSGSGFRDGATPTKHHVARVRVARAFAELREPGARARTGACERACEDRNTRCSRR